MKLNFTWKENGGQYSIGESLYLNKIRVASYGWNGSQSRTSRDENKNYQGAILLPYANEDYCYAANPVGIKIKIESVVNSWFKEALK